MIQRILIYSGVVLLLLVMLVVMNLKFLIDGPLGSNLKFPALLETLEEQIEEEQWDQAKETQSVIQNLWRRYAVQVGVSLQTSEVTAFEEQLIRLETALEFQDKPKAMEETRLMMYTWRTLGQ
ncbi:MAG TPA: DUF4363 family protein [Firmicutes bacterium]|nr:DUF4363 family protein [Bacillota bacterium]